MSRSEVFRSVHLDAATRAELGRLSRQERLAEVLPRLRVHLTECIERAESSATLAPGRCSDLRRRVIRLESLPALRALAVEIGTGSGLGSDRRDPVEKSALSGDRLPGRRAVGPDVAGVAFDKVVLVAELTSMEKVAARLDVDTAGLAKVRETLAVAEHFLGSGSPGRAAAELNRARSALEEIDEEITRALEAAEARVRTVAAVQAVLEEMGYRLEQPQIDTDGTRLFGRAGDGREAVVEVTGAGDPATVQSTFTNAADAVAPSHPSASEMCEPAVRDQATFSKRIARYGGLAVDLPTAVERPTRGSAEPRSRPRRAPRTRKQQRAMGQ